MESLNRIELRGIVGQAAHSTIAGRHNVRLSLATNYAYKDRNGNAVIETTWHTVVIWESPDAPDIDKISKGDKLHIIGRLRSIAYETSDGGRRYNSEVYARSVERIDSDDYLAIEQ